MASESSTQVLFGNVNVFTGTEGNAPATPTGYTSENGVSFNIPTEILHVKANETLATVKRGIIGQDVTISFEFLQNILENLEKAIPGASVSGSALTISETLQEMSIKLVGVNENGTPRTITINRVNPTGNLGLTKKIREVEVIPAEFMSIGKLSEIMTWEDGDGNTVATLSSGVLTRVASQGYHKVASESSGAADTLDSITGTGLTDNEIIRLQINSITEPITLTHLTGTLELDGDADWTMTKLNDWIDLQYDTAGTKWEEIGRYNDPSS